MNKISFYVLSILFLISSSCLAQYYSGEHDSLLFDGANDENFQKADKPCLMKVVTVNGNVIGMAMTKVAVVNCMGEVIDSAIVPRKRVLNLGDMVVAGEPISTGAFERSFVILQINDRENLIFGGQTGRIGVRDYCRFPPDIVMELEAGKLGFHEWNPLLPHKITISTAVGELTIVGTKLSLETVKDGDITTTILKVYEGSATFGQNEKNTTNIKKDNEKRHQEIDAEQAKLNVDYQNGKVSLEEYVKKSSELQKELRELYPLKEITVNAGFESRIIGTGKPTDPVPIGADEKPWWEDPELQK
jgi:hypothetical protein